MTITVPVEIDNTEFRNFAELEQGVYHAAMIFGRGLIQHVLETRDLQLHSERDATRYRNKGLRKTCIKTIMGEVEVNRRVYQDLEQQAPESEQFKSVYLLDEELGINKIGNISEGVCQLLGKAICESSYRATARQISEQTGQTISAQGAWNVVQALGEKQISQTERNAELEAAHAGKGTVATKILYEENDGIWLKLQGQSRAEEGTSKEMKVGIAYDGVRWTTYKSGTKRRNLDNKVAIAGFMPIEEYRAQKEGLIASVFSTDEIELRVFNGDGGSWTLPKQNEGKICVLDEFHRNKKLKECIKDSEFATLLRGLLYENKIDEVLECLEAQINSLTDEEEIAKMKELQRYYSEHKEALKSYYDRGIDIPETRDPGTIHHARLGSMESNVFTLIGNRMKGRRACWSIRGGNHLAALLCAAHTTGLTRLFSPLPEIPVLEEKEEEWIDDGKPISASKMPQSEGTGYEHQHNISTTNYSEILRTIATFSPFSTLSL